MSSPKGRVLIVAGSDSGGGAGIQADLRTVSALGGFGMTAITALTAQNTLGVFGIHPVPPEFVARQMRVVLDDIGADAIKIGMLGSVEIVEAVADVLETIPDIPLVLDPVMISTSGSALLDAPGVAAMKKRLLPRTLLLTPNLPEAEALTGLKADSLAAMEMAAGRLVELGARNVLLKGGHLVGDALIDLLVGKDGRAEFRHTRVDTSHTHGTGCTLASAVAAGLARGAALRDAAAEAHDYVQRGLRNAPGFGRGCGPLGRGAP
ncbi:MAG TPA: bifunctional hydroxymethylpyrimidine kinase/phosphomethylpyrimidine kinase [Alphaproteobacteria bacterium]|nr:bifunctional hydroxymethylpyrimidine kinase/phosphomethylpyrimidine kinase [Alphaproteobacteria bacterium]